MLLFVGAMVGESLGVLGSYYQEASYLRLYIIYSTLASVVKFFELVALNGIVEEMLDNSRHFFPHYNQHPTRHKPNPPSYFVMNPLRKGFRRNRHYRDYNYDYDERDENRRIEILLRTFLQCYLESSGQEFLLSLLITGLACWILCEVRRMRRLLQEDQDTQLKVLS